MGGSARCNAAKPRDGDFSCGMGNRGALALCYHYCRTDSLFYLGHVVRTCSCHMMIVSYLSAQIRLSVVRHACKKAFLHKGASTENSRRFGAAFQERLAREGTPALLITAVIFGC